MQPKGLFLSLSILGGISGVMAVSPPSAPDSFDKQLEAAVIRIEDEGKALPDKEKWLAEQKQSRRQLAEMLGLDPMPPRGDLHATKTGEFEHEGIVVEKLHYQSLPGLYVSANLYRPKENPGPLPTVLYLCGHSSKVKDGVSYGNKAGYEHHGVWYAKHGFICLVIDTVQLGEIQGMHHGTHRENRWDWFSRGYTPAGVEAWAGIRGIDYLVSRPDVDGEKIGVTGRSGGGAYSWWVAALDERVTCAAPTAGITSLRDHVVHKCVYGHCDCMFMVNIYQWDFDKVASLVAPRPLLIVNTDKDKIFPIDGVFDVFRGTRAVYQLLGAEKALGLQVAEGGHVNVQPLNTGEFHWMLRHLKGEPPTATYDGAAVKSIPMEKLRVFEKLPEDEINTTIDRSFVPVAKAPTKEEWKAVQPTLLKALKEKVFASWPQTQEPHLKSVVKETSNGVTAERFLLHPLGKEKEPALDLYLLVPEGSGEKRQIDLHVLDSEGWHAFVSEYGPVFPSLFSGKKEDGGKKEMAALQAPLAFLCPRGEGPHEKTGEVKDLVQLRRSFYLTGTTLESWQVWDIRSAVRQLQTLPGHKDSPIFIHANGAQAVNAIYASLFEPSVSRLELSRTPSSHADPGSPAYLNVLKHLDIPTAAALAAQTRDVVIRTADPTLWKDAANLHDGKNLFEIQPSAKD